MRKLYGKEREEVFEPTWIQPLSQLNLYVDISKGMTGKGWYRLHHTLSELAGGAAAHMTTAARMEIPDLFFKLPSKMMIGSFRKAIEKDHQPFKAHLGGSPSAAYPLPRGALGPALTHEPTLLPADHKQRLHSSLRRRLMLILLGVLAYNLVIPPYVVPVDGEITSRYFLRTRPESGFALAIEAHRGIDFAAPVGTPVRAAKSGIVSEVGWSDTLGRFIQIEHWLGFSTRYAHLSAASVREGQLVLKWQRIGAIGQTGRATGPHLHFEIAFLGRRLPPGIFLLIDSARRSLLRALAPELFE